MPLRGAAASVEEILGRRMGRLGARPQEQAAGSGDGEYASFSESDFDAVDHNANEDRYVTFAEHVVDPQVAYVYGYSDVDKDPANQGKIYIDLDEDTGTGSLNGKFRLWSDNARQNDPEGHGTWDTRELDADISDRSTWVQLPERAMAAVAQDSRLELQIKVDDDTDDPEVDVSGSDIIISMTEFEQPN